MLSGKNAFTEGLKVAPILFVGKVACIVARGSAGQIFSGKIPLRGAKIVGGGLRRTGRGLFCAAG